MPAKFDAVRAARESAASVARQKVGVEKLAARLQTLLRRRMPAQVKRDLGEELNLRAGRIAAGLSTRTIANGVEVTGSGRQIGVVAFGAKWSGTKSPGLRVEIIRGSGKKVIPGAFIRSPGGKAAATGPQGLRRKKVGNKRAPRYPLERVPTVTIAQSLKKPSRVERLDDYAQVITAAEADRLLKIR